MMVSMGGLPMDRGSDIQIVREICVMQRLLFFLRQGQHAAGMPGIERAEKLVFFPDAQVSSRMPFIPASSMPVLQVRILL